MIKVRITNEKGTETDWEISTMETLAKCQAQLTEEAVKCIQVEITDEQRNDIIDKYLNEVDDDFSMRADFVERIENGMTNTFDDIVARALYDTDYGTIDEMSEDMDRLKSAMEDIYSIAREWC